MSRRERPPAIWFVWRLIRHRPGLFTAHAVYITAAAYFVPLFPALIVRALLDRLSDPQPAGLNATTLLALLAAVSTTELLMRATGPLIVVTLREHAEFLLRRNLLAQVLERPGAQALPSSPGDALVRFQKDAEEVSHALDFLGDPIGQVVSVGFALAVLGSIDPFLTAAVFVPAGLVMLVARVLGPRITEARRSRQEAVSGVSGLLGDAFTAVATIQGAGAEERVTWRLVELGEARRRATLRDVLVDQAVASFSTNTATVATGVLLLVGASRARAGALSAGDFAVFVSYLRWLSSVVRFVGHVMTTMRQAGVSVDRMGEVLQAPARGLVAPRALQLRGPLPSATPTQPDPDVDAIGRLDRLTLDGLTFVHPSSGRGIVDVSLEVEHGEIVAVTGRVGAGKTTLLRALLGLLPADEGTIEWNGTPIERPGRFFVPPRSAYTPQTPRLFSAGLAENVAVGLPLTQDELDDAARAAVLDRDLTELPDGWQTLVGPRGVMLSGGQVQRTAAARMFARRPDLLVFDDLSSALDVETEEELWRRLLEHRGATALVVTHRHALLRRADRVVLLRSGHVDGVGAVDYLLRTSAEMRALWSGDTR